MKKILNQKGSAGFFTLVELLFVIAIIIILAALLFPCLRKAKIVSRSISCKNSQKQIYTALNIYIDDYSGWMPVSKTGTGFANEDFWYGKLNDYLNKAEIFTECREKLRSENLDKFTGLFGYNVAWYYYSMVAYGCTGILTVTPHKVFEISKPSSKIFYGDSLDVTQNPSARGAYLGYIRTFSHYPDFRHEKKAIFMFCDGHVMDIRESISGSNLSYWASFYLSAQYDSCLIF